MYKPDKKTPILVFAGLQKLHANCDQFMILKKEFEVNMNWDKTKIKQLSEKLGLTYS